jgi:hypothetical protein
MPPVPTFRHPLVLAAFAAVVLFLVALDAHLYGPVSSGPVLPEWSPEGWRLNPPSGVTTPAPQPGITLGAYAAGVGRIHPECGTTRPYPPLDGSTPAWWFRNPDSTWVPFDYIAGPSGWEPPAPVTA